MFKVRLCGGTSGGTTGIRKRRAVCFRGLDRTFSGNDDSLKTRYRNATVRNNTGIATRIVSVRHDEYLGHQCACQVERMGVR